MSKVHPVFAAILETVYPTPLPTNALSAIHAIALKKGVPAEDITGVWEGKDIKGNVIQNTWAYTIKHNFITFIIDLSNE